MSYYFHFVINSNVRESDNMIFQTHWFPHFSVLETHGSAAPPPHPPAPNFRKPPQSSAMPWCVVLFNVHPGSLTWNLKINPFGRGDSFWKPSFSGSMLNFGGVCLMFVLSSSPIYASPHLSSCLAGTSGHHKIPWGLACMTRKAMSSLRHGGSQRMAASFCRWNMVHQFD